MNLQDPLYAAKLGGGYRRLPLPLAGFKPLTHWVVIREQLQDVRGSGFIVLKHGNATRGSVLAVSDELDEDLSPGDDVLYEEWEGGRWAFPDPDADGGEIRCLIMDSSHVLAKLSTTA